MRPLLLSVGISVDRISVDGINVDTGQSQTNKIAPGATKKAGLVATHQHIGLVTVLHKGKAVKGGFSVDGRQTAFAARAVILMAAKRCALPRLAETAC
jgi:hypothetical protein